MSDGVLSQSWHTRLCHRNQVKQLFCFRCGQEIKIGDHVHTNSASMYDSKGNPNKTPVRVYHASPCWESMFIEC